MSGAAVRLAGVVSTLGAALALPTVARAQEVGRFRFAWVRDEGAERCPAAPAIAREVARRLGRDPFVAGGAPSIEASVQHTDGRWTARLIVRDADDRRVGAREFTSEAADCAPIAAAITLGVALSIDPEAALRPPAPPAAPAPTPAPAAPSRRETPWSQRGGASARVLVAGNLLPGAAPGVALAADGTITGRWRWSVGLQYFPDAGLTTRGGAYAFGLVAGWAAGCVDTLRTTRFALTGCVGAEVGALRAVVERGDPSSVGERPWGGAFAGLRLRARVAGSLAGELGGDFVVPLARDRFFEGGPARATAFQQESYAFVAFGGLGLQFP